MARRRLGVPAGGVSGDERAGGRGAVHALLIPLSPRQREVFLLRIDGLDEREIAAALCIALPTCKKLQQQIREQFDADGTGRGWWILAGRAYERDCQPECLRERTCQCQRMER